jgi:hypothetical protein
MTTLEFLQHVGDVTNPVVANLYSHIRDLKAPWVFIGQFYKPHRAGSLDPATVTPTRATGVILGRTDPRIRNSWIPRS